MSFRRGGKKASLWENKKRSRVWVCGSRDERRETSEGVGKGRGEFFRLGAGNSTHDEREKQKKAGKEKKKKDVT